MITINSNPSDNVFLPPVLQDKKPRMHSGSQASDFNEPEISFNTLNQVRNVKTSTSSNASGDSNERRNENISQNGSTDKNEVCYHQDLSNNGSETNTEMVKLKVLQRSKETNGENQSYTTGKNISFTSGRGFILP